MTFWLKLDLDNAAFEDPQELGRILRAAADNLDSSPWRRAGDKVSLRDINGNAVGYWEFVD